MNQEPTNRVIIINTASISIPQECEDLWQQHLYNERRRYLFTFLPASDCLFTKPRIKPSLNGNNGSWTNSDDVDNAERCRAHKEAHTNRFRSNPGAKKFSAKNRIDIKTVDKNNKNKEKEATTAKDAISEPNSQITGAPPPPVVITRILIENEACGPYYNGREYIRDATGYRVVPNANYRAVKHGPGYFDSSSDPEAGNVVNPGPCVQILRIEGYYRRDEFGNDMNFPETEFIVLTPLLELLQKNFSAATLDSYITKACYTYVTKNGPIQFRDLCNSTALYWVTYIHYIHSKKIGNTILSSKLCNNGQTVGFGDYGVMCNILQEIHFVDWFQPRFIEDAEYDGPGFEQRDDYSVIKSSDVDLVPLGRGVAINFTEDPGKRRGRTVYFELCGLGQPPFIEYSNSPNNMNAALKRLIGRRDNEDIIRNNALTLGYRMSQGYDYGSYDLVRNGRFHFLPVGIVDRAQRFIADHVRDFLQNIKQCTVGTISHMISRMQEGVELCAQASYYELYSRWLYALQPFYPREYASQIPHIKGRLRRIYLRAASEHTSDELLVSRLKACIKRELAKFGKAPRLFVSYDAGCMYFPEGPEFVKMCLDGMHVFTLGEYTLQVFIMAKPKSDTLEKIFSILIDGLTDANVLNCVIYSDDSCYSGNMHGKRFGYNVDVASNDSGQDIPAFIMVEKLISFLDPTRSMGLIKQCMQPIDLVSPSGNGEKVTIQFDGPFEGSGTTITTILNHCGSLTIALGAFYYMVTQHNNMDLADCISAGGAVAGHNVTVEVWCTDNEKDIEKIQFLKRSPAYDQDAGKWVPSVNLGCILRSLGQVQDELTHVQLGCSVSEFRTLRHEERMERFFTRVVQGWVNEPANEVMMALRDRFNTTGHSEVQYEDSYSIKETGFYKCAASHASNVRQRYDLTSDELTELLYIIRTVKLGGSYACSALAKIYHRDYGVPLPAVNGAPF